MAAHGYRPHRTFDAGTSRRYDLRAVVDIVLVLAVFSALLVLVALSQPVAARLSLTPVVLLAAIGVTISAASGALLRLPVVNWPALGGMGNASWTQLAGYSAEDTDDIRWRLDVWNASAQVAGDVL